MYAKYIYVLAIAVIYLSCNSPVKKLEDENKQLKAELELFKSVENNRQKAIVHADTRTFKIKDERDILSVLFDTEDFDVNGYAVWSPNFAERIDFPISYDGFCYTTVNKVLLYNDEFARAVVVFGTYEITDRGEPVNGHPSAPMLSLAYFTQRGSDEWELTSFKKSFVYHGSWGEMGDVAIKQLGKQKFVLDLSWGYTNMGESVEWTTYYNIPSFDAIFNINTAHSFTGFEENDSTAFSNKVDLIIKPSAKTYFDIVATTIGTKPNNVVKQDDENSANVEVVEPVISANNEQTYYYNEQAEVYLIK